MSIPTRAEFKNFYLIQRFDFRTFEVKKGKIPGHVISDGVESLDSFIHCHYMGSTEFEWGARPSSLKRIVESIQCYRLITIGDIKSINGKKLVVFVPYLIGSDQLNLLIDHLVRLSIGDYKFYLQEHPGFSQYCMAENKKSTIYNDFGKVMSILQQEDDIKTKGWWDIEHDIFWSFNKKAMEGLLKIFQMKNLQKQES